MNARPSEMSGPGRRDAQERNPPPAFRIATKATAILVVALTVSAGSRVFVAFQSAMQDNLDPLRALGLGVVLPITAFLMISMMRPSRTREGILMRLGTMMQLILIVAVPPFALHLLLGLPVVFLIIEIIETRMPSAVREPINRSFIR